MPGRCGEFGGVAAATPPALTGLLAGVRASIGAYVSGLDENQQAVLQGYWQAAATGYADALADLATRRH